MRILYIANDLAYFRAHRENIAVALAKDGHDVVVASGDADGTSVADWPTSMRLVALKMDKHALNVRGDISLVVALRRLLRDGGFDVVHAITIKPILMSAIAMRLLRFGDHSTRPLMVRTFAGLGKVFEPSKRFNHRLRRWIVTIALKLCARGLPVVTTFENPHDRETMIATGLTTNDTSRELLGTGLSLSHYRPSKPSRQEGQRATVLMAARLLNNKGVNEFINAARMAREANLDANFILAGHRDVGDPDAVDPQIVDDAVRNGVLQFAGSVAQRDMPALLNRADIFCLPTKLREGFPRSLVEAAACGCALIAADQPTIRRVVIEGETGWLLNDVTSDALFGALKSALADLQKTRHMGESAARLVHGMSVRDEDIIAQFCDIYGVNLPDAVSPSQTGK